MSIGKRIRRLRVEQQLTQKDVSERTGLATSYLSRVENSQITPSVSTLEKLASAFDVALGSLFDAEDLRERGDSCPVSPSGACFLDHTLITSGRAPRGANSVSRRQLEIMRKAAYLVVRGDREVINALGVTLSSMMALLEAKDRKTTATKPR